MKQLAFDEASHSYTLGGVKIPGVTSLLDLLHSFAGVPRDILEAAKKRGSAVHLACEFHDLDELDEPGLQQMSPHIWGYLQGWKKFLADHEPNWTAIEQPIAHQAMRYAGTPDRFGAITYEGQRIEDAQVDIKTSISSHPCWGVQTMAYNQAAGHPRARRFTCRLRADGTYKLDEWKDPNDWAVFVSLLTLHQWKQRNPK